MVCYNGNRKQREKMIATTKYEALWPSYNFEYIFVKSNVTVEVLHKAADQDGWNGGYICMYSGYEICVDEGALKFNQE